MNKYKWLSFWFIGLFCIMAVLVLTLQTMYHDALQVNKVLASQNEGFVNQSKESVINLNKADEMIKLMQFTLDNKQIDLESCQNQLEAQNRTLIETNRRLGVLEYMPPVMRLDSIAAGYNPVDRTFYLKVDSVNDSIHNSFHEIAHDIWIYELTPQEKVLYQTMYDKQTTYINDYSAPSCNGMYYWCENRSEAIDVQEDFAESVAAYISNKCSLNDFKSREEVLHKLNIRLMTPGTICS